MEINGAVVLVTGASSGIGAATARATSRAGAQVVLVARREDRIRQLASELGEAVPVRCDVTDAGQVDAAVRAARMRSDGSTSCATSPVRGSTRRSSRSILMTSAPSWN